MREILFRAKNYRTKQWVYGIPFKNPLRGSEDAYYPQIIPEVNGVHSTINSCSIIEETIGQFTGLTDKNGVKIFEGDIVKGTAYSGKFVGIIVWIDEIGGFGVRYRKRQEATAWENSSILKCASKGRTDEFTAEIIGNIYDNPELIGGEADD
jgi:uncharacterized phage protein (TIGR01671 family)